SRRNTWTSPGVTHPSTTVAQARFTSEGCVVGFVAKRSATRGLHKGSLILVLLSPKHA
ncbi:unnamed protein product, partial [Musa textilis]